MSKDENPCFSSFSMIRCSICRAYAGAGQVFASGRRRIAITTGSPSLAGGNGSKNGTGSPKRSTEGADDPRAHPLPGRALSDCNGVGISLKSSLPYRYIFVLPRAPTIIGWKFAHAGRICVLPKECTANLPSRSYVIALREPLSCLLIIGIELIQFG